MHINKFLLYYGKLKSYSEKFDQNNGGSFLVDALPKIQTNTKVRKKKKKNQIKPRQIILHMRKRVAASKATWHPQTQPSTHQPTNNI